MRPTFSEFSYGFALVNEFVHWAGQPIEAVPIFPSLIEEGNLGYDVMLDREGVPLFLQFKLSHCMVRNSAWEVRRRIITTPFYRMHLHARNESNQHQLLIDRENAGNAVFYAAPEFHEHAEFNNAYRAREVIARSSFWRPVDIGPLPDDAPHHVAFRRGEDHGWFCSKPQRIKKSFQGEALAGHLDAVLTNQGKRALSKKAVEAMAEAMLKELLALKLVGARAAAHVRQRKGALERVAFLAAAYYGAQMMVVQKRPNNR